jgi:tRNA-binding protein
VDRRPAPAVRDDGRPRAGGRGRGGTISFDDFLKVDIRVGTIVEARPNEAARKPSYRLVVDFGPELGRKTSSAQLVENYRPEDLVGRQVAAVVNFPPRQVAKVLSEVLVLGFPDADGNVVLVGVDRPVPNGGRLY